MIKRLIMVVMTGFLALSLSACAGSIHTNVALTKGPPIHETIGPYDGGFGCVKSRMTDDQKLTSFSAGSFPDRTGQINYVSDSGTGTFSSQGLEDMILTSLSRTGVRVVDSSAYTKASMDWTINKLAMTKLKPGQAPPNMDLLYPDVIINGAITTFDFLPGSGLGASVAGVKLSHQQTRILVSMDARAVTMPGSRLPGPIGMVVASDRPSKQIVGYEDSAGVTGFFGPKGSQTAVSLDFGHKPNEAIQYAERIMIDRTVLILVTHALNITSCDAEIEKGDTLANLQ